MERGEEATVAGEMTRSICDKQSAPFEANANHFIFVELKFRIHPYSWEDGSWLVGNR